MTLKPLIVLIALLLQTATAAELTPTQRLWKNSFDAEKAGNYKQALEYNAAIRNEHASYFASLRAGWLNYLLENYEEAVGFYQQASTMAPGAVTPLLGLGNCYTAQGDSDNAIRVTRSVLALDPTNYTANKRLAELYWNAGDFARSSSYYLKLSSLFPEDLDIASSLAWCYLKQGRTYEASVIINNILIVNPDHAGAQAGRAALQAKPRTDDSK